MEADTISKNGISQKNHNKSWKILSFVVGLLLFLPIVSLFADADSLAIATRDLPDMPSSSDGLSFGRMIGETILLLFILIGPLFMIGHMIYVLWDTNRLNEPALVESFVSGREKKGMSREATSQEEDEYRQLLDEAWETYSQIETDENGQEYRAPGKMKELLNVHKIVKQVEKSMPTDEATIEKINEHKAYLYSYMQRSFFSSWKLIILGVLVAIGMSFVNGTENFWKSLFTIGAFFWVPCIVYWLSGNVTQYMIDKKAKRGGGGGWFVAALVGIGLGVLASGQTVRTRYTDGSYEDDNSSHWIALMLGAIILFIVACTIYIWSIVNYLRNYVLYV